VTGDVDTLLKGHAAGYNFLRSQQLKLTKKRDTFKRINTSKSLKNKLVKLC
ncbi:hypothetical protein L9F63_011480, partial [Diploptera punctata]